MKMGRVILIDWYTRDLIQANPDFLFVFGDNLNKQGFVGQSEQARGCKNSVGIPTKITPVQHLFDDDVDLVEYEITKSFVILRRHLKKGGFIVWPESGVGTGCARLDITAPLILQAIEECRDLVFSEAISVTHEKLNQERK